MNQEYVFIYNTQQGIFYIKNGLIPVDFGTGNKGDAFMKFLKDDEYKRLFNKWCLHEK